VQHSAKRGTNSIGITVSQPLDHRKKIKQIHNTQYKFYNTNSQNQNEIEKELVLSKFCPGTGETS